MYIQLHAHSHVNNYIVASLLWIVICISSVT